MRDIERSRRGEVHTAIPVVPGAAQVALLTLVLIGLWTAAAWPFEPRVMQAQQKLKLLGFDPGAADGLLGPRTRKALQEFQRAHTLPLTDKLDPPTLQALGLLTPADPTMLSLPLLPSPAVPWRVVLTYLRYYDAQPARLLPYVTKRFRQDMTPRQWIESTVATLAAQHFLRLSWSIESVEMDDSSNPAHATVQVQSRVRLEGQEQARQEVFSLIRIGETQWRIDAWHSTTPATEQTAPPTGF